MTHKAKGKPLAQSDLVPTTVYIIYTLSLPHPGQLVVLRYVQSEPDENTYYQYNAWYLLTHCEILNLDVRSSY